MDLMYKKVSETFAAPAKINLTLAVVGKRADGYHDLETWMHKVDLNDWITLTIKDKAEVHVNCDSSDVPDGKSNIVHQAATQFFSTCKESAGLGVVIDLEKNIPVAAGMGGGSSDAGTVLKGLNLLFGNPLSIETLAGLGLKLGADVPFFVSDYISAKAEGVGEVLSPLPVLDNVTFVIVNPGIAVSTKWVFNNLLLTGVSNKCILPGFLKTDKKISDFDFLYNDLEQVTIKKHPVIREIKDSLLAFGASAVLMSGSGSTVFGIFPDSDKKSCKVIDDAVKTMRLRFRNKTYKVRASAGAWPSG